jgi:archaellum component FlaF (FlaF/FlaG flagellin family)
MGVMQHNSAGRERAFVIVLLLLGTLIVFGVLYASHSRNVYRQVRAASKPHQNVDRSHRDNRP